MLLQQKKNIPYRITLGGNMIKKSNHESAQNLFYHSSFYGIIKKEKEKCLKEIICDEVRRIFKMNY